VDGVSVVIPWRPDGDDRLRALAYVLDRLTREHPTFDVVLGETDHEGPWCKAAAVKAGLARTRGDLVVVHDADVYTTGLAAAVRAVGEGAPWAVPHWHVHRLTAAATARVLTGGPLEGTIGESVHRRLDRPSYVGYAGGGITVLPRATYARVPLDPRFVGWGQEDESWEHALTTLAGSCWRGQADLWHLWHPPQQRMTSRWGNPEGAELGMRYEQARRRPEQMRALIDGALHANAE
jgi:hypothetical protein